MNGKITALFYQTVSSITNTFEKFGDTEEEKITALCFQSACENLSFNVQHFVLIDSVIDRVWERLNTGCWRDVPQNLRDTYGYASCIKALVIMKKSLTEETKIMAHLTDAIKTVDMGLLLGSSLREELSALASSLCQLLHSVAEEENRKEQMFWRIESVDGKKLGEPVLVALRPSIESFLNHHFSPRIPVKLKNSAIHWPAIQKWKNVDYILEKIGPRTVPVEIGSSYASSEWSQKLMTVKKFIQCYMLSDSKEVGYLAQHQLFNQIPELLEDVCEPEYCVLSDDYEHQNGIDMNAWFGPAHTVSPLHYDPKHNLLTQVVGIKRVLLIDPKWSENVYPYDDHLLHNTAQVNPENPDFKSFPLFKEVKCLECILEPGDMLYIPPRWWHHVRSLSTSFSVSFWWS